jgi:hypothetical protein
MLVSLITDKKENILTRRGIYRQERKIYQQEEKITIRTIIIDISINKYVFIY